MRLLHRARHQGEILETVVAALVGAGRLGPRLLDDLEAFGEAVLAFLVGDAVGVVGARKGATADAENEPAATDLVDRRGFFGEAQRVTKRQNLDCGTDLDARRARGALRVEALDVAAFGAGGRVDDGVDQGRFFGGERLGERVREAWRVGAVIAPAAERLDDPLVTRIAQEAGRRIRLPLGVAAIDTVIVEDDGRHRQVVTADRLDLHAAEAKGAVALDRDDGLARHRGGADRVAHAYPHDAPGTAVEAVARHVHVDDVAAEIERVGALVDDVDIGMRGKRVADGAQGGRKIHRAGIGVEARRHALDVLLLALADLVDPRGLAFA